MPIIPALKTFFAGSAEKLVTALGDTIDKTFTNKEEREAAKLAITQEVNRHMEQLESNAIKEIELGNADRDSAREREAAIVKATGKADTFQHVIGYAAIAMTIGIIVFIMFRDIPDKNEHILLLVVGEILGITTAIYNYHFGSSAGSRFKDMKK